MRNVENPSPGKTTCMHKGIVHKIFNISFGVLQKMLKYKGGFKCNFVVTSSMGRKLFFWWPT